MSEDWMTEEERKAYVSEQKNIAWVNSVDGFHKDSAPYWVALIAKADAYIRKLEEKQNTKYWDGIAAENKRLREEVKKARSLLASARREHAEEIRYMERDFRDEARDIAAKERWKAQQGDEYGSY